MTKIFISYRRDDTEFVAGRIYERLASHFGKDAVFMDVETMPMGVDFVENLSHVVSQCDILLAVIGEKWLGILSARRADPADFVRIEICAALERNIPVIPVLIGKTTMPSVEHLPDALNALSRRNAAEVKSGRDFNNHVDRLIRGIELLRKSFHKAGIEKEEAARPNAGAERKPGDIIINSLGMKFAWIPPGTFLMGSPKHEKERESDDGADETQHKVTLTKGFCMGIHVVTREHWQAVVSDTPNNSKNDMNMPVDMITWDECQEFITKLRNKDNKAYCLPTEAEWEYACRAGTTTPFYFGETISTKQANFNDYYKTKYEDATMPVGTFPANAWGLYDMHGNVWEWCQDWVSDYPYNDVADPQGPKSGQSRVLRGGSWFDRARLCRSASRGWNVPSMRGGNYGFRLCFSVD